MVGKLAGLITVVDGKGEEFDVGELTTYLNDAVLLAPSFPLRHEVRFAEADANTFDVTLATPDRASAAARSSTSAARRSTSPAPTGSPPSPRVCGGSSGEPRCQDGSTRTAGPWLSGSGVCGTRPKASFSYLEGRWDPANIAFNVP